MEEEAEAEGETEELDMSSWELAGAFVLEWYGEEEICV